MSTNSEQIKAGDIVRIELIPGQPVVYGRVNHVPGGLTDKPGAKPLVNIFNERTGDFSEKTMDIELSCMSKIDREELPFTPNS